MLLILAGITITYVLGEDGIIAQAKLAAEKTRIEELRSVLEMIHTGLKTDQIIEEFDDTEFLNRYEEKLNNEKENGVLKGAIIERQNKGQEGDKIQVTKDDYTFDITAEGVAYTGKGEGGGTGPTDPVEPTPETPTQNEIAKQYGIRQEENKTVTDGTDGAPKLTIPKGYTVLEPTEENTVKYEDNDNPKIDEGIVIKDDVGNEFVWVPVPNPEEMYGKDNTNPNYYLGKLYNFSSSGATPYNWKEEGENIKWSDPADYREPDILDNSTYDANQTYLDQVVEEKYKTGDTKTTDDFKKQLQEEFKAMIDSVNQYNGFYIGRYETSGLTDEETPTVKPGKPTASSSADWYWQYKNSKKIEQKDSGVTSSMIWGSQWDATIRWFISCGGTAKDYVTNSDGMGWYSDNKSGNPTHKTGEPLKGENGEIKNRVNNIYDMAGNLEDWTIEAYGTFGRASRGR